MGSASASATAQTRRRPKRGRAIANAQVVRGGWWCPHRGHRSRRRGHEDAVAGQQHHRGGRRRRHRVDVAQTERRARRAGAHARGVLLCARLRFGAHRHAGGRHLRSGLQAHQQIAAEVQVQRLVAVSINIIAVMLIRQYYGIISTCCNYIQWSEVGRRDWFCSLKLPS